MKEISTNKMTEIYVFASCVNYDNPISLCLQGVYEKEHSKYILERVKDKIIDDLDKVRLINYERRNEYFESVFFGSFLEFWSSYEKKFYKTEYEFLPNLMAALKQNRITIDVSLETVAIGLKIVSLSQNESQRLTKELRPKTNRKKNDLSIFIAFLSRNARPDTEPISLITDLVGYKITVLTEETFPVVKNAKAVTTKIPFFGEARRGCYSEHCEEAIRFLSPGTKIGVIYVPEKLAKKDKFSHGGNIPIDAEKCFVVVTPEGEIHNLAVKKCKEILVSFGINLKPVNDTIMDLCCCVDHYVGQYGETNLGSLLKNANPENVKEILLRSNILESKHLDEMECIKEYKNLVFLDLSINFFGGRHFVEFLRGLLEKLPNLKINISNTPQTTWELYKGWDNVLTANERKRFI